jgi:uncharacterized protein YjbJ (UPF0337 family)
MGRKKRRGPEEMVDKAVGGLSEATGRVAGDRSLEAEGQALRTKGKMKTYLVKPHAEEKKGGRWKLRGPDEPPACTGRNPRRWRRRRSWRGDERQVKSWCTSRMG